MLYRKFQAPCNHRQSEQNKKKIKTIGGFTLLLSACVKFNVRRRKNRDFRLFAITLVIIIYLIIMLCVQCSHT